MAKEKSKKPPIFVSAFSEEITNPNVSVGLVVPGGMKTGLWEGIDEPNLSAFNDPAKVANAVYECVEYAVRSKRQTYRILGTTQMLDDQPVESNF